MVPGLVRLTVAPAKSSGLSLFERTLRISSSYAPQKPRKFERVGVLDHGDEQRAGPVALLHVDSDAQPQVLVAHDARLALGVLHVAAVHHGHGVVDGAHDREADDVGEGDLPAAGAPEISVDHPPVDLEQLGRHLPEAGGGGNGEAGLHVGDDAGSCPADRLAYGLDAGCGGGGRRGGGGRGRGSVGGAGGRGCRDGGLHGRGLRLGIALVVLEEVPPALADRSGVGEVLLVHLVHEPRVRSHRAGPRVGGWVFGHGADRTGVGIHHSTRTPG